MSMRQLVTLTQNLIILARNMAFYAVARGHKVGIYETWTACEKQVKGFTHARFKKFKTRLEAEEFIRENATDGGKEFLKTLGQTRTTHDEPTHSRPNDFWPASDGDNFQDDSMTDEDLLQAIYEVEGLPDKSLKRKAACETSSSAKIPKHSSQIIEVCGSITLEEHEFPIDDDGYVICYTDGSCINNGKSNACAGFGVYFGRDHALNTAKPVIGRVTNNVGEIQAAVYALQIARDLGIRKLCICTDSQFLINAATLWIAAWKRKDWRLRDGSPVKNANDFKVLDLLLEDKKVDVKWNYVKGHAKIEGNEKADELARCGAALYARQVQNNLK